MIKTSIFLDRKDRHGVNLPGRCKRRPLRGARRVHFKHVPWLKAVVNRVAPTAWIRGFEPSYRCFRVTEATTGFVATNHGDYTREEAVEETAYELEKRKPATIRAAIAFSKSRYAVGLAYRTVRRPSRFKFRTR